MPLPEPASGGGRRGAGRRDAGRRDPMTPAELKSTGWLASVFALRMLGLFLILPVFPVHARGLPGGDQPALVGLALGIYGLTQALLQWPLGSASDRFGRKPVIMAGLLVFALGSFLAAGADDVWTVVIGRALQGAGAISAAITALLADLTRETQRTKAMALVGVSIGLSFAVSLVAAPLLYEAIGMGGIFAITGVLALAAIVAVWRWVPAPSRASGAAGTAGQAETGAAQRAARPRGGLAKVLRDPMLWRLDLGIFILHTVQMAMFVVVPVWLVRGAGLPVGEHWKLYLPVMLASALLMAPLVAREHRGSGSTRGLMLGSIGLLAVAQIGLAAHPVGIAPVAGLLVVFFTGFNVLEASLPSLVSRVAPAELRGSALGAFNTAQSLGLFAGGGIGGWIMARWGGVAVFAFCCALLLVWLSVSFGLETKRWHQSTK